MGYKFMRSACSKSLPFPQNTKENHMVSTLIFPAVVKEERKPHELGDKEALSGEGLKKCCGSPLGIGRTVTKESFNMTINYAFGDLLMTFEKCE